jgi:twinkle protein
LNNLSAGEISKVLAQRAESFCEHLFPNGKKQGHEYCVGSIYGEAGESLKIHLTGEKSGVWCDFSTNDKGDLLDLIRLNRSVSLVEAIKHATLYLGMGRQEIVAPRAKSYVRPKPENGTKIIPEKEESSHVRDYLVNERFLTDDTLNSFRVWEKGSCIVFNYFRNDELVLVKYLDISRENGKKKIAVSKDSEPSLFGWQALSSACREVTICEGELDCMSLHQYGIPALSVPFGAGNHQWIENEFERLSVFDKIYICFDNDDAGKKGMAEVIERLGRHRCFVVTLPKKDANACLMDGILKEYIEECFIESKTSDPVELREWSDYIEEVIKIRNEGEISERGYKFPWKKIENKILLRPGELSIWTGINGHGKSQMLGHVLIDIIKQGATACIASFETKPKNLVDRMLRQATGIRKSTDEFSRAVGDWMRSKCWIFDLLGNAKSERLLNVFKYARQRYGIDTFVIDSFMKLDIAEDDYKAQKTFLEKLCDFKNEFNCHVHLVVHPRKGQDEVKVAGKMDMKGTGAISDLADNCFTVWRNKSKEETIQKLNAKNEEIPEELLDKPDALLSCDKQRNGEWEGKVWLWFNCDSFQYLSSSGEKPTTYVYYSNLVERA